MLRLAGAVVLAAGAVNAHMSPWMPSMYGNPQLYPDLNPITPLGPDWSYDEWWFRGPEVRAAVPADGEISILPAGGSITLEIACGPYYTTMYGADPNGNVACDDPGPYHADPNAEEVLQEWVAGCALGIADVLEPGNAGPDNFTIFSVQQECVWTRNTTFEVPAQMPACSGEWCLCGWVWSPQTGQGNAYHTPFRCKVTGSPADATPIAPPADPLPCEDDPSTCQPGAKKMIMIFNEPTNVHEYFSSDDRPRYDDSWGFFDGAQDDIFLAPGRTSSSSSSARASTPASTTTTSRATTATPLVSTFASSTSSDDPTSCSSSAASSSSPHPTTPPISSSTQAAPSLPPARTSTSLSSSSSSSPLSASSTSCPPSSSHTPSTSTSTATSNRWHLSLPTISLSLPLPSVLGSLPVVSDLLDPGGSSSSTSSATAAIPDATKAVVALSTRSPRVPFNQREATSSSVPAPGSTSAPHSTPLAAEPAPAATKPARLTFGERKALEKHQGRNRRRSGNGGRWDSVAEMRERMRRRMRTRDL